MHLGNGVVEVPVTITPLGQEDTEDAAEVECVDAADGAPDADPASDQPNQQPREDAENSWVQQQPQTAAPPRSAPGGALTYLVSYTAPAVPGLYRLQVVDGATGRHVRGSPFSLRVRPGPRLLAEGSAT